VITKGIPRTKWNARLTDALARSPMRYVLVGHEQAASCMAEVYGRLTGRRASVRRPGTRCDQPAAGTADATTDSRSDAGLSLVMTDRIEEIVPHLRRCEYAARLAVRLERPVMAC
jgi:hypothetical protein